MRLTKFEQEAIKESFKSVFMGGEVYLFGSRVDDSQKGGDIDLFLVPRDKERLLEKKIAFLVELKKMIGLQKIDVIISKNKDRLIEKEALKTGIKLCEI